MKWLWLFPLVISSVALGMIWYRTKLSHRWLAFVGLKLTGAVLLLYVMSLLPWLEEVHIPMNMLTVSVVAGLGIPGLVALSVLKMVVI